MMGFLIVVAASVIVCLDTGSQSSGKVWAACTDICRCEVEANEWWHARPCAGTVLNLLIQDFSAISSHCHVCNMSKSNTDVWKFCDAVLINSCHGHRADHRSRLSLIPIPVNGGSNQNVNCRSPANYYQYSEHWNQPWLSRVVFLWHRNS